MSSGYINLTSRCPHTCINCPIHSYALNCGELSLEEIYSTIDSGIRKGMDSIVLSGGEPTFHTRFFDVIKYLAQYPIKVSMLTTAISFSNDKFIERLLDCIDVSRVRIASAIHSFDASVNDYMTQNNKTFRHIMRGLHNAIDAGISTSIKHLITKPTYQAMPEFVRRYSEEFPINVPLLICNIDYCGRAYEHVDSLKVSFKESRPYLEAALDYLMIHQKDRAIHVLDTPLCVVSRRFWRLLNSQAGQVIPVYNAPANRERKPIENMVNTSGPYFMCCHECCVRHVCPGAWMSTETFFSNDIAAIKAI